MPRLLVANETAWRVFALCSSQMRVVGMGTPLGLEFSAIETALQRAGVNPVEEQETFFKVHELGLAYARHLRIKEEARQAADAKKNGQRTTRVQRQPPPMFTPAETAAREAADAEEILRLISDPWSAVSSRTPGGADDEIEV